MLIEFSEILKKVSNSPIGNKVLSHLSKNTLSVLRSAIWSLEINFLSVLKIKPLILLEKCSGSKKFSTFSNAKLLESIAPNRSACSAPTFSGASLENFWFFLLRINWSNYLTDLKPFIR